MSGKNRDTLHNMVLQLYQAREAAKAARKASAAAWEKAGGCKNHQWQGPCWLTKPVKRCDACEAVMTPHETYRKAANKAGAALRLVLREGKRMSQDTELTLLRPERKAVDNDA